MIVLVSVQRLVVDKMPELPEVIFIAGTDTGVGKTTVAALLLALMREAGIAAAPMKPVETGCPACRRSLAAADLELCLKAAGMHPDTVEKQWMAPYRFALPASPHLAAAQAGRSIRVSQIRKSLDALKARYRPVLVEGAGGLMVPLRGRFMMLDLVAAWRPPLILVARSGLGTINHTLLTLSVLAQRNLPVAGVIFNDGPDDDERVAADNVGCIPRLSGVRCLGRIRFRSDIDMLLSVAGRDPAALEAVVPGRRRWIRKVLRHVG